MYVVLECQYVEGTDSVMNANFETPNTGWTHFMGHNDPSDLRYVTSTFTEGTRSLLLKSDVGAQITFSVPDKYDLMFMLRLIFFFILKY